MTDKTDLRRKEERRSSPSARRSRSATALAVAAAGLALAVAGCGGSSSGSSSSSPPSGSSPGSSQTANSNKLAQFSQCMRAHGLTDFPDPVNGHLNLRVSKGSDLDPSSPAYQSAIQACKSLEPAGFGSNSSQNPQQQSQILKFVSCMRTHGVPNMPDPQPNGTMLMSGGQIDPNSPQFQNAMQACRSMLPAGAVGG